LETRREEMLSAILKFDSAGKRVLQIWGLGRFSLDFFKVDDRAIPFPVLHDLWHASGEISKGSLLGVFTFYALLVFTELFVNLSTVNLELKGEASWCSAGPPPGVFLH